jgi:hypothetical protein
LPFNPYHPLSPAAAGAFLEEESKMQPQRVSVNEVVNRLEAIQREAETLLGRLRPLLNRLHYAEDALVESVLGDPTGESRSSRETGNAGKK